MSAYLDKERIPSAITDSTKFDLSHVHITTGNFMQLQPIMMKEMVPGEKIDVNVETFSRMNPLPVPTFGRANIKNRAYFVPFRTIFRGWNDFITDAPHQNSLRNPEQLVSLLPSVPYVTNKTLMQAMTQYIYKSESSISDSAGVFDGGGTSGIPDASSTSYDVCYDSGQHVTLYKRFTPVGRTVMKTLESLGYKINWNFADTTVYSALPLLAFAKVYIDWYFPSAYTNSVDYSWLQMLCNADPASPIELNYEDVGRILQMSYVCYDSDYFTSAWDNPTQPGAGKTSDYKVPNLDYVGSLRGSAGASTLYYFLERGSVQDNSGSAGTGLTPEWRLGGTSAPFITPVVATTSSAGGSANFLAATPISQYLLHGLHALTDYLKRHQLAGGRAFDRYLARYGKALSSEQLNRSKYIGSQIVPVQIGDVMSNSDTEGAPLGQYAGKGMAYNNNGNFTYSTDEFGMFIIVSSIVPATGYFQGVDPMVKRISRLQFWTPEFESLGTEPITADQLYITNNGVSGLADVSTLMTPVNIHEQIFGYTPRYSSYKMCLDKVTGNMRVPALNGASDQTNNGGDSWHLMRVFDDSDFVDSSNNASVGTMVHSLNFVYSRGDIGQYNRIFDYSKPAAPDQFTIVHQFNVGDYAPMKPLYDSWDFEDKGKKITLEVNGVKHN